VKGLVNIWYNRRIRPSAGSEVVSDVLHFYFAMEKQVVMRVDLVFENVFATIIHNDRDLW